MISKNYLEFAKILGERKIDIALLIEFIDEAVGAERNFAALTAEIISDGRPATNFLNNLQEFRDSLELIAEKNPDLKYCAPYSSDEERQQAKMLNTERFVQLIGLDASFN